MKSTLLFATLSMMFATPTAFAKSELETLRSLCSEQERQIRQLEVENSRLRSGDLEARPQPAKTESAPLASAKPAGEKKPYVTAATTSTYTIKAGDSLAKIARKVGTTPEMLAKSNGLKSSSVIHPGHKLKVPGVKSTTPPAVAQAVAAAPAPSPSPEARGKSHKVLAGETFSSISRKHGITAGALAAANPGVKATSLKPGQVVRLGGDAPSTTMISSSNARPKVPAAVEKAPAPAIRESIPVSAPVSKPAAAAPEPTPAPAPAAPPVVEKEIPSPAPEKKIRPVTIEGEMTYGEFAAKHGTDSARLNALNGLDLTTATVLAKGSELYVPAQP